MSANSYGFASIHRFSRSVSRVGLEHVLAPGHIPRRADGSRWPGHLPRAGKQVVAYPLIDLKQARGIFVKEYVWRLEEAVIRTLSAFGARASWAARRAFTCGSTTRSATPSRFKNRSRPPGSPAPQPDFTGLGKIAALGIKVSNHRTYHGVALNVVMDLEPFARINPCGYAGLKTVDLSTIGVAASFDEVARELAAQLQRLLALS